MTDTAGLLQGPQKGYCGCQCGAFGTYRRKPWKNGVRCVRACVSCKQCKGAKARSHGDSEARKVRRKLELAGPHTRHEEFWTGPVRVEVKAGRSDAMPVITRFRAARAQSEASRPIGDGRPFVAVHVWEGEQVASLAVDDLKLLLEAL